MTDSKSETISNIIQRFSKGNEYFPEPIFLDSGIFIYGAGDLGQLAIKYCESSKIKILGVIDQAREGLMRGGVSDYQIYKPYEVNILDRQKHPVLIAVATAPFLPISNILASHQWSKILPFYSITSLAKDTHPLANGWLVGKIEEDELEEVKWVCNNWSDSTSLKHYEAFLAWHINCSELPVENGALNPNQRYAIEPLLSRLREKKNQMVDVGSHEGESVKRLLDAGILFSEYILIEPDSKSRKKLRNNIQTYLPPLTKVDYKEEVIGSQNGFMAFEEGLGYCSQLWSKSKNIKPIVTLDSLKIMPDLIKIHTEGSELDILKGAAKTIDNYKPALAYSVYHNRDGVCRAIIEPMRSFDNYRWYFRLHSYQGTGAFVYGIPK
jgi:FkbM family methyltransferase